MKRDPVEEYQRSDDKPDKRYSILPTVLNLAQARGKRVLDVGCGSGFFSRHLYWRGAERVFGLDNDANQIKRAKTQPLPRIEYREGDMFTADLSSVQVVVAPFVLNHAREKTQLRGLLRRFYEALEPGGRLVGAIDLPTGRNLKRFGAIKRLLGEPVDGTLIEIDIYCHDQLLCQLPWEIFYWRKETLERLLLEVGFARVGWHLPIVSAEGIEQFGEEFWEGYIEESELGYLTAEK